MNLLGTDGNDRLIPDADNTDDIIRGLGGNDLISGRGGTDEIRGDGGSDTITGVGLIYGGTEDDELTVGGTGYGGTGQDRMRGSANADELYGDEGGDTIDAYGGTDLIFGGIDNDLLNGMGGNDTIEGGEGDDTLVGGRGQDDLKGGRGADLLIGYGWGFAGTTKEPPDAGFLDNSPFADYRPDWDTYADTLTGGSGNDTLRGTAGDQLFGGVDNDQVAVEVYQRSTGSALAEGGDGSDSLSVRYWVENLGTTVRLVGGAGTDFAELDFWRITSDLLVRANSGIVSVVTMNLTVTSCEWFRVVGGSGNDRLVGVDQGADSVLFDVLRGSAGNDTIQGLGGDDLLFGDDGTDRLEGGAGNDSILGGEGNDTVRAGQGNDAVSGEFGDDRLEGDNGNDTIAGNDGNDAIYGGIGNDSLSGGSGQGSTTAGPDGADTIYGGEGNDTLVGDDNFQATSGPADVLYGGNGNDEIYARAGDDTISGGQGDDVIFGHFGNDLVTYAQAGSAVTVNLRTKSASGGDGNDTLNDVNSIEGSAFDDRLTLDDNTFFISTVSGLGGNDRIVGGAGNSVLTGGEGNDTVTGGAGNDVFVFAGTFGNDRITDFAAGPGVADRIDVDHGTIDTFAEILAAATNVGADTRIDFGPAGTILLVGVAKADLTSDDFAFL